MDEGWDGAPGSVSPCGGGGEQISLFSWPRFCQTDRPGDIVDPWYILDFEVTWRDIEEGCRGLLEYP